MPHLQKHSISPRYFFPEHFLAFYCLLSFTQKNNNCKKWDLGLRRNCVINLDFPYTLIFPDVRKQKLLFYEKQQESLQRIPCSSTSVLVIRNTKLLWDRRILLKKGSQVFSLSCHKLNTLTSPDTLQIGCP